MRLHDSDLDGRGTYAEVVAVAFRTAVASSFVEPMLGAIQDPADVDDDHRSTAASPFLARRRDMGAYPGTALHLVAYRMNWDLLISWCTLMALGLRWVPAWPSVAYGHAHRV